MKGRKRSIEIIRALYLSIIAVLAFSACGKNSGRIMAENGSLKILWDGEYISVHGPKNSRIYYTTDGSMPAPDEKLYSGPFKLEKVSVLYEADDAISVGEYHIREGDLPVANVIRAAVMEADGQMSGELAATIFDKEPELLTISVITDYKNLLDYESGIMVRGRVYDEWAQSEEGLSLIEQKLHWMYQGNFTQKGKNWERQILLELHENGKAVLHSAGIRIRGGASRYFPQKSFNIYFREKYGEPSLEYPLFPDGPESFSSFILRNGGNDLDRLKFKDAWLQSMLSGMDFSVQMSRPALVYLNGEYWGIYNLAEKYSREYFESHYGVDDVLMMQDGEPEIGEDEAPFASLSAFEAMDLSAEENWEAFKKEVDVHSMADYFAAQVYIGNCDFRQDNNYALWRSADAGETSGTGDGRWRFVLMDTEYSSSLYGKEQTSAEFDHFSDIMQKFPLFASAMENMEFRTLYNAAIRRLQEIFSDRNVTESLELFRTEWEPYMKDFYTRFGNTSFVYDSDLERIKKFFSARAGMEMTVPE